MLNGNNIDIPSPEDEPLDGNLIERVFLVDQLLRLEKDPFRSSSTPGHMIHICTTGAADQRSEGRQQDVKANTCVWYHQGELTIGEIIEVPWTFYTINFLAPSLPPPSNVGRVLAVTRKTVRIARELHEIWHEEDISSITRRLRVHIKLLELILMIYPEMPRGFHSGKKAGLWWQIEDRVRQDFTMPISMAILSEVSGYSLRVIHNACKTATGISPMRRIKVIRLDYARGLVLHSRQRISEIARQTGYPRVQEFSRDYRKMFNCTPLQDRAAGPGCHKVEHIPANTHGLPTDVPTA
ncbi:MAG: AraC family transcriptional regulator [bacterium]|nr:AraC family transcriptional regulator [bacterium]